MLLQRERAAIRTIRVGTRSVRAMNAGKEGFVAAFEGSVCAPEALNHPKSASIMVGSISALSLYFLSA
jgi:hypothetical protein